MRRVYNIPTLCSFSLVMCNHDQRTDLWFFEPLTSGDRGRISSQIVDHLWSSFHERLPFRGYHLGRILAILPFVSPSSQVPDWMILFPTWVTSGFDSHGPLRENRTESSAASEQRTAVPAEPRSACSGLRSTIARSKERRRFTVVGQWCSGGAASGAFAGARAKARTIE